VDRHLGRLQHFDPNSGKFDAVYAHEDDNPDSLASNDLNALALDAKGGLWIGTWPGGMDYLAPGASVQAPPGRSGPCRMPASTCAPAVRPQRRAVDRHRVRRHPLGRQERLGNRKAIASPYSRITNFGIDNKGVLWCTTLSAGLLRWNEANGEFDQFVHAADDPYSLPGDNLRAVMQDRGGMLWIASFTDGIAWPT
jgi:ligand-binding sensor domain-containing protein